MSPYLRHPFSPIMILDPLKILINFGKINVKRVRKFSLHIIYCICKQLYADDPIYMYVFICTCVFVSVHTCMHACRGGSVCVCDRWFGFMH